MRRKWLLFGYYLLAISLLSMTLSSCDNIRGATEAETAATETREARRLATRVAATKEAATMIAEVETYEARETSAAEATAAAEAVSIGVCGTPGACRVVEGEFDVVVGYIADSNEVNISFPVDGGPVSGDLHFSYIYEARDSSDSKGYVCRARIGFFATLSGHFDPENAKLEGPVDDFTHILEVLEGCEEIEVDDWAAISWWATYDLTTGILKGEVVYPDDVAPFHGTTVSEEPSKPLD